MPDQTITCPKCRQKIPLSETLRLELKEDIEKTLQLKFEKRRENFVKTEKRKLWAIAQEKAKEKLEMILKDEHEHLKEQEQAIDRLKKGELELRREKRKLETEMKDAHLVMERKLDKARSNFEKKLRNQLSEEFNRKLLESQKREEQMRKKITELKRKSEQGSQQVQGDAAEMGLKEVLSREFVRDAIEDIKTGVSGGDLLQKIEARVGKQSGLILWESKQTKEFSRIWITKLRDDQVRAKADVAILATTAMPKEGEIFLQMGGVCVVDFGYVVPFARLVRDNIAKIYSMRSSLAGGDQKMNQLYKYLLSPEFKTKIENIISAFTTLRQNIDKEKRAMHSIWSRREKEIERVLLSTSSMYGDLQGVTGEALPKIPKLELPSDTETKEDVGLFEDS